MRLLLEFICFVTFARCKTKINVVFPELRNGSKVIASQTKGVKLVTKIGVSDYGYANGTLPKICEPP